MGERGNRGRLKGAKEQKEKDEYKVEEEDKEKDDEGKDDKGGEKEKKNTPTKRLSPKVEILYA